MGGQRFCERCGAPLESGMKFCTKCGARVGDGGQPGAAEGQSGAVPGQSGGAFGQPQAQPGPQPGVQPQSHPQPEQQSQSQPQTQPEPPAKKRSAVPVIVCVVALALVAGAGAFALTDGFSNLPGSSDAKTEITRIDAGSSDASGATSGSASKGKKDASKQKSDSSSAAATPQKSAEELDRDAAVTFANTFWTNAVPSGENGADCSTIDDWTSRNLALVDPSCALYGEIQDKGMDMLQAEDSCVSATVDSQQGNTVTVTVGVAGHRENPSAGWEKNANFTYRMDIKLTDSDKVVGFTSYYTDPSTGKTYSQSH